MRVLAPVHTAGLFEPLHTELLALLRGLQPDDWVKPTIAGSWRVRDVAAHLLDGDLRALSVLRDGHIAPPEEPIAGYDDLVRFLDQLNASWIAATQRLSPRVLVDLLDATGAEVARTVSAMPPHAPAPFPVAWAGEDASENWMHVGREYTERWHHQMQIRDAVGAPALFEPRWLAPLLDLSLRALPHAYREVEAAPDTRVVIDVEGPGGGTWCLLRKETGWALFEGATASPATQIRLDADTAWKSLYHALSPAAARQRAQVEGDEELAAPFFGTRSVMV